MMQNKKNVKEGIAFNLYALHQDILERQREEKKQSKVVRNAPSKINPPKSVQEELYHLFMEGGK